MPGVRITPTAEHRSGLPTGFCVNRPVYAAQIRLHFRRRVFPGAGQRVLAVQPRLAFPPNVVEAAFWTMGTGRHVGKRPEASAIDVDARGNCFARARAANHQLAHLCAADQCQRGECSAPPNSIVAAAHNFPEFREWRRHGPRALRVDLPPSSMSLADDRGTPEPARPWSPPHASCTPRLSSSSSPSSSPLAVLRGPRPAENMKICIPDLPGSRLMTS